MRKKRDRQKNFDRIVNIFCVILLGISLVLQSQSVVMANCQKQVLRSIQTKDVILGKGKPKRTYYKTTLDNGDYGEDYDFYLKNKIGLCWAVYFSGDKLYFHGSMIKSKVKSFPPDQEAYLGKRNRSFITTTKTKYYIMGDEPTKRISRKRFSAFLTKANKGLLSFGIILTKENGKAVKITIEI